MIVPVADPDAENALVAGELNGAVQRVVSGGVYIPGPRIERIVEAVNSFSTLPRGISR